MKNLTDFRKTLETGVDPGLSKELGEKITKKHGKNSNSKGDICYLENICGAGKT